MRQLGLFTLLLFGILTMHAQEIQCTNDRCYFDRLNDSSIVKTDFNSYENVTFFVRLIKPLQDVNRYRIKGKGSDGKRRKKHRLVSKIEIQNENGDIVFLEGTQMSRSSDFFTSKTFKFVLYQESLMHKWDLEDYFELMSKLKGGANKLTVRFFVTNSRRQSKTLASTTIVINKVSPPISKHVLSESNFPNRIINQNLEDSLLIALQQHGLKRRWVSTYNKVAIIDSVWEKNDLFGYLINAYCYSTTPDGHCLVEKFKFEKHIPKNGDPIWFDSFGHMYSRYSICPED